MLEDQQELASVELQDRTGRYQGLPQAMVSVAGHLWCPSDCRFVQVRRRGVLAARHGFVSRASVALSADRRGILCAGQEAPAAARASIGLCFGG